MFSMVSFKKFHYDHLRHQKPLRFDVEMGYEIGHRLKDGSVNEP